MNGVANCNCSLKTYTLSEFPKEILIEVFSFLLPIESKRLAHLCKKFSIVVNDNRLWRLFLKSLYSRTKELKSSFPFEKIFSKENFVNVDKLSIELGFAFPGPFYDTVVKNLGGAESFLKFDYLGKIQKFKSDIGWGYTHENLGFVVLNFKHKATQIPLKIVASPKLYHENYAWNRFEWNGFGLTYTSPIYQNYYQKSFANLLDLKDLDLIGLHLLFLHKGYASGIINDDGRETDSFTKDGIYFEDEHDIQFFLKKTKNYFKELKDSTIEEVSFRIELFYYSYFFDKIKFHFEDIPFM
ncbi:MAG: F-box protein [Parachlamydiales bacterium]|nr:F-box protein [Parachlamydiales bacterium]